MVRETLRTKLRDQATIGNCNVLLIMSMSKRRKDVIAIEVPSSPSASVINVCKFTSGSNDDSVAKCQVQFAGSSGWLFFAAS